MRFVSLHHHSTFSYLDGYQLPSAHVRRATELNMSHVTMTEHGNIDSHVKLEMACEKEGLKPIFGCEFYMPCDEYDKDGNFVHNWYDPDVKTQRKHHLTVLAKDQEGYANLLQLVTKSWRNFYYEPTVSWADLVEHRRGLIVLSGCSGSLLFCSGVGGKGIAPDKASFARALRVARRFKRALGENYLVEVQAFPELESVRRWCRLAPRIARAIGTRLVATVDCHYTLLQESEVQQILHNLRPGEKRTLEEQAREWGYNVPLCPPLNDASLIRRLKKCGLTEREAIEAAVTTEDIAQECTAVLPKLPMVRYPLQPPWTDPIDYWRHLLRKGWKHRGCDSYPPAKRRRYRKQLQLEMDLIESKDFVDYFLLIQAGIVYLKDLGVPVGPGRGSGGASLAAWLLRITEVDPLRPEFEGLLRFERFISVDRIDLPDFDIDVPSEARPMLRQFYIDLMGSEDNVNNVGTFVQFKGKNSLDDVARVFNIPEWEVKRLKDFLIERSSGDLRASSTIEDTIEQFPAAREIWERHPELAKAALLEGGVKSFGVHAAALVLSNKPITNVTPIIDKEVPKGSGQWITCVALDKKAAERQGLVKMDFLGLSTMSMLWNCLKWTGRDLDWLYNLPLDDPRVYAMLQRVDVTGIFSMEGRSQRYVCSIIKPEKFSEIMDCGALCRPGPLHNGSARIYGEIKQGGRIPDSKHPVVADLLAPTQFQMVYQEQILRIARVVGGFDDSGVSRIRKIISLKEGVETFNRERARFLEGVKTLHDRYPEYPPMSQEIGAIIWGDMITSGAYAFNAPHTAAYGLITYACCHVKEYDPDVFYAATLYESTKGNDKPRTRQLLRDADAHGVRVLVPSLTRSKANWRPVKFKTNGSGPKPPTIRAGFWSVDGIGEKTANVVEDWVKKERPASWNEIIKLKGFGPKTVEKVTTWINKPDPFGAFALNDDIEKVKKWLEEQVDHGGLPVPTHSATDLANEAYAGKALHVYWLGTFIDRNIRDIFEQNRARGKPLNPSEVKDPHLNEWAMLSGEDDGDQLMLNVDRWHYPHLKQGIFNFRMGKDLILVQGVKPARAGTRKLKVKKFWVINPDEE